MRLKIVSACIGAAFSCVAGAAIEGAMCEVNGVDACGGGDLVLDSSAVLTLTGWALDMSSKDFPRNSGHVIVQHADSGKRYRLPIRETYMRPSTLLERLPQDARLASADKPLVRNGLVAQVFMASLPPGRYSVVEVRVSMQKNGSRNLELTAENRAFFTIPEDSGGAASLVSESGQVIPVRLSLQGGGGGVRVTDYPPLRDGDYTLRVAAPAGEGMESVAFRYARPVYKVDASIPIVEAFPGFMSRLSPPNPLDNRLLNVTQLPVVVDQASSDSLRLNGQPITTGQQVSFAPIPGGRGLFSTLVNDDADEEGDGQLRLFVNLPDAPHIEVTYKRWNPASLLHVAANKPETAVKVEDLDVAATLSATSAATCQALATVRPEYRLVYRNDIQCAIEWMNIPEGMRHNPFRSNALLGSVAELGENVFAYRAGIIFSDPTTRQPAFYPAKAPSASLVTVGREPAPIAVSFQPARAVQPFYDRLGDRYPGRLFTEVDPRQQRLAGNASVSGAHRGIRTRITLDDGTQREGYTSRETAAYAVAMVAREPWESKPVTVETWYERAPEYKTTEVLDFLGVPLAPSVTFDRILVSHDEDPTVISGGLGIPRGMNLEYDESTLGKWEVSILDVNTGNTLGSGVMVSEEGRFEVDVGTLPAGSRTIRAVATMLDQAGGQSDYYVQSGNRVLVTETGGGIDINVTARLYSGAAPFYQTLYASPVDSNMYRAIEYVRWERLNDDSGEWERILTPRGENWIGMGHTVRLESPGTATFRGIAKNRHSGRESVSEPIELQAYLLPTFRLEAPGATVAGQPVTITAIQDDPEIEATFDWSFLSRVEGRDIVVDGNSFTFTPEELGTYAIQAAAREVGAPDTRQATVLRSIGIRAVNPLAARATLQGPRYVESGQTYTFTARINDVVPAHANKNYEVKGYWLLPDGSRVHDLELSYTVQPSDSVLSFVTYVDGFPDQTAVSMHTFSSWTYNWPEQWQMALRPVFTDVPAEVLYTISPVGVPVRELNGEPLTYTWVLPEGVTREGNDTNGRVRIHEHGTYQIGVQIADTRGNVVNVTSDEFAIFPPAQVDGQLTMVSKYGEAMYYAPGTYYLSYRLQSVPRGDRFLKNELYVNGDKVSEFTGSSAYVSFPTEGDYRVMVRTLTQLGNYGDNEIEVSVQSAPTPECTIQQVSSRSAILLQPECTVDAGYVQTYVWTYMLDNKEETARTRSFAAMRAWLDADRLGPVSVRITTDLGAHVDIPVTVINTPFAN